MTVAAAIILRTSFVDALDCTRKSLAQNGFCIENEVDVAATVDQKHAVGMEHYRILDACHPQPAAQQVVNGSSWYAVRLVCNVVVRADPATVGNVIVELMNPCVLGGVTDEGALGHIAAEVGAKLRAVIDAFAAMGAGATNGSS
jgi:uncharacterized protein (DUF302 family)